MSLRGTKLVSSCLLALVLGLGLLSSADASACGGFFSRGSLTDERRPSLAYEQTLILFDAKKQRQDFIREVTFRAGREAFGFVVPTPTRPSVAKVAKSPFERLRTLLPFGSGGPRGFSLGGGSGQGFGAGGGVKVLEVKKVGSFTAFVLAADDEKALAAWLKKHQLTSTPEADRWLARYVRQGFFYVAMRYDPPADAGAGEAAGRTKAETVRISFDTPLPYYPYFEPDPPKGETPSDPRMLEIWLVTNAAYVPVATREQNGKRAWVRPFAEGRSYGVEARAALETALDADKGLLFSGELRVQRFMDQKRSRVGFGDVVFVPAATTKLDDALRQKLGSLAPVLDPSLAPEKSAAGGEGAR